MKEKELRFALVCFGGVSLAIYMHGICKEILKLVRASRAQSPLLSGKILTYDAANSARVRITEVNPRPGCGCGASKMQPAAAIGVGHRADETS